MAYHCTEPRCRWAAFNGTHPDLLHAVWWGCTKRPPRPFAPGDLVTRVADPDQTPTPVHHCQWDSGVGYRIYLVCPNPEPGSDTWKFHEATGAAHLNRRPVGEQHGGSNRAEDLRLVAPATGHTQPSLFDLLETAP